MIVGRFWNDLEEPEVNQFLPYDWSFRHPKSEFNFAINNSSGGQSKAFERSPNA